MPDSPFNILSSRAADATARGRLDEALAFLDEARSIRPRDAHILNSLGVLFGRLGRFEEATASFREALSEKPADADLHYNLAYSLQCQGNLDDALAVYNRTLLIRPNYAAALNNRGLVHHALGRCDLAIGDFARALETRPNDTSALNNVGHCLLHVGRFDDAIPHLRKALLLDPVCTQALQGLAIAFENLDRTEETALLCRQITARAPTAAIAWAELGAALIALNDREAAEACLAKARTLSPKDAKIHARIGRALLEAGAIEAAKASFSTAVSLAPRCPNFLLSLTRVEKLEPGDSALSSLEFLSQHEDTLNVQERIELHFALGKTLFDSGDNDRSFRHFVAGNKLQRQRQHYDEAGELATMAAVASSFNAEIIQRCQIGGSDSRAPIFILGMPRTGSTLVEQILAAHENVVALGERRAFPEAVRFIDARKRSSFPAWLPHLEPNDLHTIAQRYLERLFSVAKPHAPHVDVMEGVRFVDKMPGNFLYAGLIRLAFPNASIIHTRRNSIDTCLSCFQTLFDALPYTNDLGSLGRFYRHYEALMDVWSTTLPEGSILTIDYETLVKEFEPSARKIVAHCGLDWDDASLSFHKVKRPIRTASVVQVRQPLYDGSLKKWRPSTDLLRPLLEGLRGVS